MAPKFGYYTTGREVVDAFAKRILGKTFVITGPSAGGIGAQAALDLARARPALLILAGRSESSVRPVTQALGKASPNTRVEFVPLDLASQASVRAAAAEIKSRLGESGKIDVLVNNAGIFALPKFETTADGVEMQFGVNHLGHFLLTNLLMDRLRGGKGARVVNLTSSGFNEEGARLEDINWDGGKKYHPLFAYMGSKHANVLFSMALAKRLPAGEVASFSCHPGTIPTNLPRYCNMGIIRDAWAYMNKKYAPKPPPSEPGKTLEQGCATTLWCALAEELDGRSGTYQRDCGAWKAEEGTFAGWVFDEARAEKLWEVSEGLVGEKFPVGGK